MIKAKDLLKFAQKKTDPEDATLKECTKIAAERRSHVWDGVPLPIDNAQRRSLTNLLTFR